ncbi:MAG TPA: ABC transporter permease [Chloroflexota bacterium]|nr:ABC transporter permease [Chloroflexota bacterium]
MLASAAGSGEGTSDPRAARRALTRIAQQVVTEASVAAITLGAAFLIGALLILCTTANPRTIIKDHGLSLQTVGLLLHYPFNAYVNLFSGAFGAPDMATATITLEQTVPLVFTGMAVAFAFRAGLFNIGAEGQLYMGAIAATWVGVSFPKLPGPILLPLVLLAAIVAGALWGGIAGFLKAYRGAHEVITTIMLNYTAIYLTTALVSLQGPLISPTAQGQATSSRIGDGGLLPALTWLGKDSGLDAGAYLALVALVLYWFVIWRTSLGYEIRAVGLNAGAAAYGGIPVNRRIIIAMAIAGALAGLAGGTHIAAPSAGSFQSQFSPGWGFDGIAVALLGKGNPIGILLAAILFAALRTGGPGMQAVGVSPHIAELLQGIIVLFVALDAAVRRVLLARRRATRVAAMAGEKAGTGGAYSPSVEEIAAASSGAGTWDGLLVVSVFAAICSVLFVHVALGALALILAALYALSQRRITRGVIVTVIVAVVCLALGLAVDRYL